jgi:legumain
MEDADKAKMGVETLQDQFNTVQKATSKSHVLQWGELDWTNEPIGNFESGTFQEKPKDFWSQVKNIGKKILKDVSKWDEMAAKTKNDFAVDSRDIKLHYLYQRVKEDPSVENMSALQEEIEYRNNMNKLFEAMFPVHFQAMKEKTTPIPTDFDCLRNLVEHFEE